MLGKTDRDITEVKGKRRQDTKTGGRKGCSRQEDFGFLRSWADIRGWARKGPRGNETNVGEWGGASEEIVAEKQIWSVVNSRGCGCSGGKPLKLENRAWLGEMDKWRSFRGMLRG